MTPHAFGTFDISPAEQARMPKAGGDRSSRTLNNIIHDFHITPQIQQL